jgi:hypothetical protein
MDDSTRVKRALERALPESAQPGDPHEDLAHARTALRTRTRHRLGLGAGALALVLIAGVGVAGAFSTAGRPDDREPSAGTARIHLVSATLKAKPYSFGLTPTGWSVQSQSPYAVTIAPDDGSVSSDPDVFVGKLVITFEQNPPPGHLFGGNGRPVWIHVDSHYTTMSTRTTAGEPGGIVRIQYPDDAGWERPTMLRFLRSVHVGPGAKPALG